MTIRISELLLNNSTFSTLTALTAMILKGNSSDQSQMINLSPSYLVDHPSLALAHTLRSPILLALNLWQESSILVFQGSVLDASAQASNCSQFRLSLYAFGCVHIDRLDN